MRSTRYLLTLIVAAGLLAAAPALLLAQQAPPAEGDETQLTTVLQSDAPLFEKAKACQQLAVIGTKDAVPVLAKLLADEQLSHYARFGLEPIPDPSVDDALRDAMGKLRGNLLVGVINTIGMRRDTKAVDGLKRLLGSSEPEVAAAAAAALGRISTAEAVEALRGALSGPASLRPAVADACLTTADTLLGEGKKAEAAALYDALRQADLLEHLQIAALHGAIRARGSAGLPLLVECLRSEDKALFRVALRMAQELAGDDVTQTLVEELPKLRPAPEASPKALVITKAEYGAKDKWVDVTDKLAAAVRDNKLSVRAENELAGDPIQNVPKRLRVVYTLDGRQGTTSVREGELLQIQCETAPYVRQTLLIYVLGVRGDKGALPAVLEAAKDGSAEVRMAAIRVLADLGDASAVPMLLAAAVEADEDLAKAAHDSLAELPGKAVDAALAAMLNSSQGKRRLALIDLVGQRGIRSAVPALWKAADADDPLVRVAAIRALGFTATFEDLPALIDRFLRSSPPEVVHTEAKEALRKVCLRAPDRDACAAKLLEQIPEAKTVAKGDLLDLLGVVGGSKALEGVSAAARDANEDLQDAATRVLGQWMSPDAAPVLLELAKTGNDRFKTRALRGYIRIARQLDVATEQRIAMCREALAAAGRNDEKKLALEVLARYPSPESLSLVVPYLGNAALKEAASAAAVSIAEKIVDAHPAPVAEAMKKAAQATGNRKLAKRAKALLGRARAKLRGN